MLVGYRFIEATFRIVKSASNINFFDTEVWPYFTQVYTEIKWLLCVRFCTVQTLCYQYIVLYLTYGSTGFQFAYLWEQETEIQLKPPRVIMIQRKSGYILSNAVW